MGETRATPTDAVTASDLVSATMVCMAGKPKKPPIEKKTVLARLAHAQEHQLLVHVRRWIPEADRVEGFVVGIGHQWVVLQRLSDRVAFDGWQLLRLKDIQAVSTDPESDCFEVKVLKARSLWPPTAPDLDLDDVVNAFNTPEGFVMVSVFDEFNRPDACWIGAVMSVDESKLELLEVNTRGDWARKPRTFDLADVTRLDFGGGYEQALSLVAGPPRIE
jgi:hypothetical protein